MSEMTLEEHYREVELHRQEVAKFMLVVIEELACRAREHDQSKMFSDEADLFRSVTPKMKGMTYGSEEYKACLREIKPAIYHHYAHNRHHPEHFGTYGISGMHLVDLIEMLCDWLAATKRHEDGSVERSLKHNRDRFNIPQGIMNLLENTVELLYRRSGFRSPL